MKAPATHAYAKKQSQESGRAFDLQLSGSAAENSRRASAQGILDGAARAFLESFPFRLCRRAKNRLAAPAYYSGEHRYSSNS